MNPAGKVDQPPAHHPVNGQDLAVLHQPDDGRQLLGRQLWRRPRSLAVDQPVRPLGVEPQRPVAKDLPVHPARRRGLAPAGAVVDRRQRQQPSNLTRVPLIRASARTLAAS